MKRAFCSFAGRKILLRLSTVLVLIPGLVISENIISAQQKKESDKGLKIFMLWDMEGTSGLFTKEQAWYWDEGVAKEAGVKGCGLLTADVNAAARAALDAGVTELIICDTHHGGNNIIPEKLLSDSRITFLPRSVGHENGKRRWMPGLDETVDGFMVMGHHAKAGTEGAFLHHTQNLDWKDFTINGQSVGEMGIELCYAGHWNIPAVMVTGDEHCGREAEQQFPGIISAVVKHAVSYEQAAGLDPEEAHKLIADKVKEAVKKLQSGGKFTTYKPKLPMTVTLKMTNPEAAQKAAKRYNARLIDPYTLEAVVSQQSDVIKWITGTGLDMAPEK
jgi:D-amino peptidase